MRGRTIALWLLIAIAVAAMAAPWLAPADPAHQFDVRLLRNATPSLSHPLGTDVYSRDVLSRALYGARTSLLVGGLATLLAVLFAGSWSLATTLLPRSAASTLSLVSDSFRALPRKLVLLAVLLLVSHPEPLTLGVLLGATSWMSLTPLLETELTRALSEPYVEAARATGVSSWRVGWRHVLPAVRGPVSAIAALLLADLIALEAVLAFLGIGVRPPTASWGGMLQDALPYLSSAWWVGLVPVVLVVLTVGCVSALTERR